MRPRKSYLKPDESMFGMWAREAGTKPAETSKQPQMQPLLRVPQELSYLIWHSTRSRTQGETCIQKASVALSEGACTKSGTST